MGSKTNLMVAAVCGGTLAICAIGVATAQGVKPMTVQMSGGVETPPGDPDGAGTATFRIDPAKMQVCYTISVSKIAPATMAHIHKAAAGASGPPVVMLKTPGVNGMIDDCATVTADVAQDLVQHPEMYYVNVHNAEFPGGALRAQLTK